ncbi:MAG: hypothetical protein Q7K42_05840, partial [Candidatus Diapherotrites archaeon]|nr:hypothetical protein [Candidatus Diapherotrites archaeon]
MVKGKLLGWMKGKAQRLKRTVLFQRAYLRPYDLPKKQTVTVNDLPPISRRAYRRIGQIFGIEPDKLLPKFEFFFEDQEGSVRAGTYNPDLHLVSNNMRFFETERNIEHELIHSLQCIVNKDVKKMETRKGVFRFTEPSARLHQSIASSSSAPYYTPLTILGLPMLFTTMGGAAFESKEIALLGAGSFVALSSFIVGSFAARQILVKNYFKKHGVDGLLLLFAFPPKDMELLGLRKYERLLVERGFLKPKGGMTEKGIRLLKRKVDVKKLQE